MKVLMCHNYYQRRGGEDEVFEVEGKLLESMGHEIVLHSVKNESINPSNYLQTGLSASWNQQSYNEIKSLGEKVRPDLVHFYNTFPLLSPSVYYAAKSLSLPVVQSLHNYRLLCINASFYRSESPCEDCLGKAIPIPGIRHACYRESKAQSLAVGLMSVIHRALATWHRKVDLFLLGSTETARQKFIQAGISPDKIMLKPNFVLPDPGVGQGGGKFALFVGRFDELKGIHELISAWEKLDKSIRLKIVGDGPLNHLIQGLSEKHANVEWCGRKSLDELHKLMKQAEFLVFPSRWYEAMPRTIIDSFAVGTPVIASNIGAMSDMIRNGESGLHFEAGNHDELAAKITWLIDRPEVARKMRNYARKEYEENYTADKSLGLIMEAYRRAARSNTA